MFGHCTIDLVGRGQGATLAGVETVILMLGSSSNEDGSPRYDHLTSSSLDVSCEICLMFVM